MSNDEKDMDERHNPEKHGGKSLTQTGYVDGCARCDRLKSGEKSEYQKLQEAFDSLKQDAMKLREALEYISCEGMDDGDFHSEGQFELAVAAISISNRARQALADFDKKWGSK